MFVSPELEARIKASAESTPFTRHVGLVIESLSEGKARVRLPYRPELARSYGIVHGGAIMTLMDTAAGLSSATAGGTYDPGVTNLTIAASTQFLGMVRERDLVAEAVCTKAGRSIVFVEISVSSDDVLVARGSFTFKIAHVGGNR